MLGGVPEGVPEDQPVRLSIAGEVGPQTFLQQAAGLLQHDFELLYGSGAKDLIESIARFTLLQPLERPTPAY